MTYKQFIRGVQRQQIAYIAEENRRIAKALALWHKYKLEMAKLGLHPLGLTELQDRQRELVAMKAVVNETHGDSPTMRWAYDQKMERRAAA